jgi:hypothetical protein
MPFLRRTCRVPLQIKSGKRAALSTTTAEFEDNMWYIVNEWRQKTGKIYFFLSFDNASIQATADLSKFTNPNNPQDVLHLDQDGTKIGEVLDLPKYSHDLNRPIEHVLGSGKHLIKCELVKAWSNYSKPRTAQNMAHTTFYSLPKHNMADSVAKDVDGLPALWQIISTPKGVQFVDTKGRLQIGTGGDYPNAKAT